MFVTSWEEAGGQDKGEKIKQKQAIGNVPITGLSDRLSTVMPCKVHTNVSNLLFVFIVH